MTQYIRTLQEERRGEIDFGKVVLEDTGHGYAFRFRPSLFGKLFGKDNFNKSEVKKLDSIVSKASRRYQVGPVDMQQRTGCLYIVDTSDPHLSSVLRLYKGSKSLTIEDKRSLENNELLNVVNAIVSEFYGVKV